MSEGGNSLASALDRCTQQLMSNLKMTDRAILSASSRIRCDPRDHKGKRLELEDDSVDSFLEALEKETDESLLKKWKKQSPEKETLEDSYLDDAMLHDWKKANGVKLAQFTAGISGDEDSMDGMNNSFLRRRVSTSGSDCSVNRTRRKSTSRSIGSSRSKSTVGSSRKKVHCANNRIGRTVKRKTATRVSTKPKQAPKKASLLLKSKQESEFLKRENKLLEENRSLRNRIRIIEKRNKSAGIRHSEIEKTIRSLNVTINDQKRTIADLRRKIASSSTQEIRTSSSITINKYKTQLQAVKEQVMKLTEKLSQARTKNVLLERKLDQGKAKSVKKKSPIVSRFTPKLKPVIKFDDSSSSDEDYRSRKPVLASSGLNMSASSEPVRNQNAYARYQKLKSIYTEKFL